MEREFILEQNEQRQDEKTQTKNTPLLRLRSTRGIICLALFAIVVPVLVYYFVIDKGVHVERPSDTCLVDKIFRIHCGLAKNVTFDYCAKINCCFDNSTKSCFHYLPSKYYYFNPQNSTYKRSLQNSTFGVPQAEEIKFFVRELDENNLEIVLQDSSYSVDQSEEIPNKNYFYQINETRLYVEVFRNNSNRDLILTTAKGPVIISKNYWEWSFYLTDQYLFGLGQTLIELDENSTLTKVIYGNDKDHNTLPIFLAYQNQSYHSLVVRNKGPLEVTVLPSNLVILKSLGEGEIVLKLSVGPTLKDVIKQRDAAKGDRKKIEMKTLGVHLCREENSVSLSRILNDFSQEMATAKTFQYESDCFHENLLSALRLETRAENINRLNELISEFIVGRDKEFSLALAPQLHVDSELYTSSSNLETFFLWNETQDYQGQFLSEKVVYPYFGHSSAPQFVELLMKEAEAFISSRANSFILIKNWPSDQSFSMKETDDFQYLSENLIEALSGTLPWNVTSNQTLQFLDHNNYGHQQLEQFQQILNNSIFMTASHNLDTLQPIILQNVNASWSNLQSAITTTLFNSISGYPLTSIPVCGSTTIFDSSHESLCLRWYIMAATAPLFRISSDLPKRDPDSLYPQFSNFVINRLKWAISFRYSILNYFYHVLENGEPLMRPMMYDFPEDPSTFSLVHQYMVGPRLLVAQPTLPSQTQIKIYLPKAVGNWYEFGGGRSYQYDNQTEGFLTLSVVEDDFVAFIREGAILALTHSNELRLKIAMKCELTGTCSAAGDFQTETNFFKILCNETTLEFSGNSSNNALILSELEIFKPGEEPQIVRADNEILLNSNKICVISGSTFTC